ncbi:hypothetical protein Ahy_B03g065064 [Arachis hypogaea]|uniref:Protein FAR1-RELATED SEQUENCE n=1 Tax=Arachis hypogaea TaxID=3818 RepID=A0A445A0P9_ARAHY|nr:hypothetical protein Ahy_B03g065064 [Arachis hypogaea]
MVEKFGFADKRWVQDMYERRHSWATAYIRGKFFAGFRTTSRCESLHAVISRACAMRVVDSKDNSSYFIHTVSRYGTLGKDWRVVVTFEMSKVSDMAEMDQGCKSYGGAVDERDLGFCTTNAILVPDGLHFENEDAADTSFPPEGPPTKGGRAPTQNPPRRNTKDNGANGGKKTQRCRLCREVGHNRTTCLDCRTIESSSAVADDTDSMDIDMVEIPSFRCSDSDTQVGFVNSNFAGTNTSGPIMSLAD